MGDGEYEKYQAYYRILSENINLITIPETNDICYKPISQSRYDFNREPHKLNLLLTDLVASIYCQNKYINDLFAKVKMLEDTKNAYEERIDDLENQLCEDEHNENENEISIEDRVIALENIVRHMRTS